MAGSRTARAGTKRAIVRRRAVGTRDRIVAHLAAVTEITDTTGMASTRLAEAVAYPGSSVAFAQLLSGMERDGLIAREVRGKRTYRIALAGGGTATRRAGTATAANPAGATAAAMAATSAEEMAATGGGLDYDELARRLLVQVIRRLAVTPSDLEQTVAGLERELSTAWSRQGTLSAENVRLREQLQRTQRDLDLARRRNRRMAISDELDSAEVVVLERLLAPDLAPDRAGDVGQPSAAARERALFDRPLIT
jgi:hypothetical protein